MNAFHNATFADVFFEANNTIGRGKERIVSSHADVFSWVYSCAQLAHNNIARKNVFAGITLHAASLTGAISPISR